MVAMVAAPMCWHPQRHLGSSPADPLAEQAARIAAIGRLRRPTEAAFDHDPVGQPARQRAVELAKGHRAGS